MFHYQRLKIQRYFSKTLLLSSGTDSLKQSVKIEMSLRWQQRGCYGSEEIRVNRKTMCEAQCVLRFSLSLMLR